MSTIKVDTIATRTGSGNITVSNNAVLSGDLTVDTTTLKVDSSNNLVGVGTASPTSNLHVSGGAGAHVAIQSSAGSHWRLGDAVGSSNGIFVVRDHTNSANRIQILADGKTQIAQGVTFGSDTAAANTLDDYEYGSWTPAAANAGSLTNAQGRYHKIGNAVFIRLYIPTITNTTSSSAFDISGLPFTPVSSGTFDSNAGPVMMRYVDSGLTEQIGVVSYVSGGSTQMRFYALQEGSGSYTPITHAHFSNGGVGIRATLQYEV